MKKIISIIVTVIILLSATLLISAPVNAANNLDFNSINSSNYLKTYDLSYGNDVPVFTSSDCSIRGTASPYKIYNATVYYPDELYLTQIDSKWAYGSYSVGSSGARSYGYFRLSDITSNNVSHVYLTVTKGFTTFTKPSTAYTNGIYTSQGDNATKIAVYGNFTQLLYNSTSGTYRLAWALTSDVALYTKPISGGTVSSTTDTNQPKTTVATAYADSSWQCNNCEFRGGAIHDISKAQKSNFSFILNSPQASTNATLRIYYNSGLNSDSDANGGRYSTIYINGLGYYDKYFQNTNWQWGSWLDLSISINAGNNNISVYWSNGSSYSPDFWKFELLLPASIITEVSPTSTVPYNPSDAVSYAGKYWSSYNPDYIDYNPVGGDCANFVSQCLFAGGLKTDGIWYTGSLTWINAQKLYNYLTNKGYAVVSATGSNVIPGRSVIFYDWDGNGTFDHTSISSSNGNVSAHNKNHFDYEWTLGGASKYAIVIIS